MLVAMVLIIQVVNSISSSCGSSKILTWAGKHKSGVGVPGPVNTNWRQGPVNTNLEPGPVNTY